jgi:hypothetical protein
MRWSFDRIHVSEEFHENILGKLFGLGRIAGAVVGKAEHHRLMSPYQPPKRIAISSCRVGQRLPDLDLFYRFQTLPRFPDS